MIGGCWPCRFAFAEPEPRLLVCVPGDVESLQSPVTEIDQILLQGFVGKSVFNLEVRLPAVRSFRADEEATVAAEELCRNAIALEPGVVEIGTHCRVIGKSHRLGVMRRGECGRLIGVAGRTCRLGHEPVMNRDQRIGGRRNRLGRNGLCGERKQGAKQ